MVYRGTYKNGVVIPEGPVELAEGQRVEIVVPSDVPASNECHVTQELLKLAGTISSNRTDESVNHDHYIYGAPKREEKV